MKNKTNQNQSRLITWLFTRPIIFFLFCLVLMILAYLITVGIQTYLSFDTMTLKYIFDTFTIFAFIIPTYHMIKKLPNDNMSQYDFVAIINALCITCVAIASVLMLLLEYSTTFKQLGISHPALYNICYMFLTLYVAGIAISGIYAKYKRCTSMGISKWKIILSMPFTLFMLWTPGYLLKEKNSTSNVEIKSDFYAKFTKHILSKPIYTFVAFCALFLCNDLFLNSPSTKIISVLSMGLLVIYALWYVKHKSDFIKNINKGYALMAVSINITILIALLIRLF